MEESQTLLELEQHLLSQAVRQNAAEISRLIADDFVEFGASGKTWTKADVVDHLPDESFIQRTISQFTARPLSEQIVQVTYQCHTAASIILRSSIWRRQNGQWQMIFHQGTPIP